MQRRFTKRIPSLHLLSYSERPAMLNLEPLELRRLRFDLVMYHKILHGLMSIDVSSHFTYYYPLISSRSGSPKLVKPDKDNNNLMNYFLIGLLTTRIIYRILCVSVTRYLNSNGA